jgi:hypothetical protein
VALCGSVLVWSTATTLAIIETIAGDGAVTSWALLYRAMWSGSGISVVCLVIWHRTRHTEDVLEEGRRLEREEAAARVGGRRHDDPERRPNTAELRIIAGGREA